jgi:YVTN family beta-propeller protein
MSNAKYVGRVGGLAVALGVGMAIATTPGMAWADDTGSGSSEGSTGTAGATGTGGTSEPEGTSTTTETTPETAGKSTAAGSKTDAASRLESGLVGAQKSGTFASSDASVWQVPPRMAMTTGGADSSTKSTSGTSVKGEVVAESTTDDFTEPKRVADAAATPPEAPAAAKAPVVGSRGSDNSRRPVDEPTGAPRVHANTVTATADAAPSRPETLGPAGTVVDVAVNPRAAAHIVTAGTAGTFSVPQTNLAETPAMSAAPPEFSTPPATGGRVLGVLGSWGLGPLDTDDPVPVDSPLGWAVVALVNNRRFGQAVIKGEPSPPDSPTLTSQTVDGLVARDLTAAGDQGDRQALADTSTMQLSAPVTLDAASAATPAASTFAQVKAARQTKPDTTAPAVSFTAPANVSGTVTLSATATDNAGGTGVAGVTFLRDGTALADEDTVAPYSLLWDTTTVTNRQYELTARARDAAGNTTTSAPVTVTVANTGTSPITPIAVGDGPTSVAITDGRAYVLNFEDSTVSVIDTTNNEVVATIPVGYTPTSLAVSPDGTRAYVTNYYDNTVSVIDTTGNSVITTIAVPYRDTCCVTNAAVSPDSSKVYVTNQLDNTVSVINTATNTISGPYDAGFQPSIIAVSPDGRRLYLADYFYIAQLDTATMTPIGQPIYLGSGVSPIDVAVNGNRLYTVNWVIQSGTLHSSVSVIDVGSSGNYTVVDIIAVPDFATAVALSPDGSRLYVSYQVPGTIMVIDTSTNDVIGTITVDTDEVASGGDIAVGPDGRIYFTDSNDDTVYAIAAGAVSTGS